MAENPVDLIAAAARLSEQGQTSAALALCRHVLAQQPDAPIVHALMAGVFRQIHDLISAIDHVDRALAGGAGELNVQVEAARVYEAAGDNRRAARHWQRVLGIWMQYPEAAENYVRAAFPGLPYPLVLREAHRILKPSFYLEIGVRDGMSLMHARAAATAVGVDPDLTHLRPEARDWPRLYPLESDRFFEDGHFERDFGSRRIDLAFIDGLHHFDAVLKDFANVERRAHERTVALIHDVIPFHAGGAGREPMEVMWTGDVWKAVLVLARSRPELELTVVRTGPTGLAVVRGLDPSNDKLVREHELNVRLMMGQQFDPEYLERAGIRQVDADAASIRRLFEGD